MTYDFNAQTGVIYPDTATVVDTVQNEWRAALGSELNTDPETPQGVMITAEVLARQAVVDITVQLANQINPNIAGGVFLDALCALMGLERRPAIPSIANSVQLTGQPNIIVPAGSQAKSNNGFIWLLKDNVQIGQDGTGVGVFECSVTGPIGCPVGALSTVVDMVLGWETVYNPIAATPGQDIESDARLRSRRRITLARQGISTREAQLSGVMDLDGVTSAVMRENVSSNPATIDGVFMVGHSVWLCVDGGSNTDVAMSLLKNKTDGAAWNGTTAVSVIDPASGQAYDVLFDRPTYIYPTVRVVVKTNYSTINPISEIPKNIVAWANGEMPGDYGLTIGQDVSPYEIAGAINYYNPGFFISRVDVRLDGTLYPNGIPVTLLQRAILVESAIVVEVQA